jgi:hypothetical protein
MTNLRQPLLDRHKAKYKRASAAVVAMAESVSITQL